MSELLPDGVTLRQAAIGNGGFSGAVLLDLEAERGVIGFEESEAKSLFGFSFTLQSLEIEFAQNALIASSIKGFLKVPFFDQVLTIEIGLTNDGDFTLAVAIGEGLVLTVPNVLSLEVVSCEFVKEGDDYEFIVSGKLTPEVPGLDWPSFDVTGLTIGSDGTVKIDGGWIDLPEPVSLDLFNFRMEISQIGFGSEENGRRWIGFSGGVELIAMLPTGASVRGLRISWDPQNPDERASKSLSMGLASSSACPASSISRVMLL